MTRCQTYLYSVSKRLAPPKLAQRLQGREKQLTQYSMSRRRSGAGRAVLLIIFAVCCSDKCRFWQGIMVQTSIGR